MWVRACAELERGETYWVNLAYAWKIEAPETAEGRNWPTAKAGKIEAIGAYYAELAVNGARESIFIDPAENERLQALLESHPGLVGMRGVSGRGMDGAGGLGAGGLGPAECSSLTRRPRRCRRALPSSRR
jgi:hypothetical protein